MQTFALRLKPDEDLKPTLHRFAKERPLRAGIVLTAVGSLKEANLRLADQPAGTLLRGRFEIVSLVGTLCPDGVHLHIALSDHTGRTMGGHLLDGCLVYTTAEIMLANLADVAFRRETDPLTGYRELTIHPATCSIPGAPRPAR